MRVLVADDHAVVRHGLGAFLGLQPDLDLVGEAADGAEAVEKAVALGADVVVMDVSMPGMGGVDATRALAERAPETRVLVLSSFGDDSVLPALQAGAVGYLLKDSAPEQVAAAIRDVHRGDPVLSPVAARRVLGELRGSARRPDGTVTILFTDIERSTAIVEELGDEQARALFRAHDAVVRRELAAERGVEVEHEGDAFMLAFSSARRALRCAVAIQRALARLREERPDPPLRVRAGLNTGEVIDEGDRYFGRTVFVASRVAAEAAGDEVLVSEITKTLVGDGTARFEPRGTRRLKGLKGSHRLFAVEWLA